MRQTWTEAVRVIPNASQIQFAREAMEVLRPCDDNMTASVWLAAKVARREAGRDIKTRQPPYFWLGAAAEAA